MGINIKKKAKCPVCGKIFTIERTHRIYCSEECRRKRGKNYAKKMYDEGNNREKNKRRRLKLRFEVFQMDNFTCQYCGRKAPNVELQIDHKFPKSKGGLDKKENYITACMECNLGKGDCILKEFEDKTL